MISTNRETYNLRKIKKFNNIDQQYNQNEIKDMIIKPIKIEKPNLNINSLIESKKNTNDNDLNESLQKRTNQPYKGIIKDCDYSKIREKIKEDLIVHKVTEADRDKKIFKSKLGKYRTEIKEQNKNIEDVYALDKKTEHKKEFDYQHKYKYRTKINTDDNDLRTDRIDFWKKEQQKNEENKKKIDDILINLIDSGVISDNLETINYDKINTKELENTLKNVFGEEEFIKILKEIE